MKLTYQVLLEALQCLSADQLAGNVMIKVDDEYFAGLELSISEDDVLDEGTPFISVDTE